MTMRWVQIISRKDQWRFWVGRGFSRDVTTAISRALAPEVDVLKIKTEILRDCMPDSNEKFVGKDTVRTAWRRAEGGRNVHSTSLEKVPQRLKPSGG